MDNSILGFDFINSIICDFYDSSVIYIEPYIKISEFTFYKRVLFYELSKLFKQDIIKE
jgi:hypothetical protein